MQNTWLVLLPPIIVLISAFLTKRLHLSLIIGLVTASLIVTNGAFSDSALLIGKRLCTQLQDPDNLYMYSFLLIIGILIALINQTGGAQAFAKTITKHLTNARSAETSSLLLSCTLFLDDYLSNLTAGYVMRPITDRFSIPRAKLAFLVHSMTGPLVILIPVSSWVAMITSQLDQAGVSTHNAVKILADPFYVYIKSIPFIFYSFLLIASIWFIVRRSISYGPMHKHHIIARTTGNLFGGKTPIKDLSDNPPSSNSSIFDLVLPIITLIGSVIIGILYSGGYYLFGGTYTLIEALKNNNKTFTILFVASIVALGISLFFSLIRKKIMISTIPTLTKNGLQLMISPVLMLILAATLGLILRLDLHTGTYLAQLLLGSFSISLLPFMFFVVSLLTATITGTSWGAIALMLPIAIPMLTSFVSTTTPLLPAQIPILFPVLGAIFSGSVCGDHISPISETTIMASTSSGTYPIDHAHTQFPYTLPAIISSALAFVIVGLLINQNMWIMTLVPLGIGICCCFILLSLFNTMKQK